MARLAGVLAASAALSLLLALAPEHPLQDITHYKYWAAHVTAGGVASAYTGTYPETFVLYPPLLVYVYRFAGWAHGLWPAAPLSMPGDWLSLLIKLPGIIFHLANAILIYFAVLRFGGQWRATAAAAAYGLNPGVLFNVAYWGQPDSVHSFLLLVAVLTFVAGRVELTWIALTLGALAKPQTWVFVPLFAWLTMRRSGLRDVLRAIAVSALAGAVVLLPWIQARRLQDIPELLSAVSQTMPVISANAHNLWWIALPQQARVAYSTDLVWGPLSYRVLGAVAFAVCYVFALLRLARRPGQRLLASVCGFVSVALFATSTQMHENHLFQAIPLVSLAWPASTAHALLFLGVSWTFLLNLLLHDFAVGPHVAAIVETHWAGVLATDLQVLNATMNLALLGAWAVLLVVSPPIGRPSAEEQRRAARTVLLWSAPAGALLLGAGLALLALPGLGEAVISPGLPAGLIATPLGGSLLGWAELLPDLLAGGWREYGQALYALPALAAVVALEALLFAAGGFVAGAVNRRRRARLAASTPWRVE